MLFSLSTRLLSQRECIHGSRSDLVAQNVDWINIGAVKGLMNDPSTTTNVNPSDEAYLERVDVEKNRKRWTY
ncbi:hypothetical protein M514_09735 [Trichuris suis]|uniref:Uncharacterized protein n=1 Tax=Trichuris suis TaxID=68888 RepID=A0A085N516_9BILA|nr:hypothetical protein M513_09735 [Trichuris suis]KFD64562.1 hypothetical protein M514_09735 [Trichuris suis]